MLCYRNYLVSYWNRLNILYCFLWNGRTWKVCFAQKTVKNKRGKLLRKRNRKLYFLKKIRGISSPKYFSKTKGSILLRNYLYSILCNIFIALCYTNYYVYLLKRLNILIVFCEMGEPGKFVLHKKHTKIKGWNFWEREIANCISWK